jgi:hypothetical protein
MFYETGTLDFTKKTGTGLFGLDEYVPHFHFNLEEKFAFIEEFGNALILEQQKTNQRLSQLEEDTHTRFGDTNRQIAQIKTEHKITENTFLDLKVDVILLEDDTAKLKKEIASLKNQNAEMANLVNTKFEELVNLIKVIEERTANPIPPPPPPLPENAAERKAKAKEMEAAVKAAAIEKIKSATSAEQNQMAGIVNLIHNGIQLRRLQMNPDSKPKVYEPSFAQKLLSEAIDKKKVTVKDAFNTQEEIQAEPEKTDHGTSTFTEKEWE